MRSTKRGHGRPAAILALAAVLALLVGLLPTGVAAQDDTANAADPLANVELPPDMGQTSYQVWVRETRHTVRGDMLDYWRANGAASVYGNPISEPFAAANGYYSQAFENGVFQYIPDYLWTEDPSIRLMPIGKPILEDRLDTFRADGRRGGGGGNRQSKAWRALNPASASVTRTINEGGRFVEATGHTISGDFLAWYNAHEGWFYLGSPLSQPHVERGLTVQYFEGGLLVSGPGGIRLAPIVAQHADRFGIDTTPIRRGDLPLFDERLFWETDHPNRQGDPAAPGPKRIEVSIGQQQLWAYQGDTLVLNTFVSTGVAPNSTEQGLFHIRLKFRTETMSGFTSSTGEVVGLGDGSGQQSGARYEVKDVPNVMYVNNDAEALHGAYWHNNFGYPMSHGCINLPLDVAAFLFGWAPLGTQVWVHE